MAATRTMRRALLVLLCLLPAFAPVASGTEDATRTLEAATRLFESGKYKAALREFQKANDRAGGASTKAFLGAGESLFELERYAEAAETAKRAAGTAAEQEDQIRALLLMGRSLARKREPAEGDLSLAETVLRRAIQLAGGATSPVLVEYALVQARRGDAVGAMETASAVMDSGGVPAAADDARTLYCTLGAAHGFPPQTLPTPPDETRYVFFAHEPESRPRKETGEVQSRGPEILHRETPVYPLTAYEIQGETRMSFRALVTSDGCVVRVEPMGTSIDEITPAAALALSKWVFRPAIEDGEPVGVWVRVWFEYKSGFSEQDYENEILRRKMDQTMEGVRQVIR